MKRFTSVVVGALIGAAIALVGFTGFLSVKYPNNARDSGLPNYGVALILAAPVGVVLGGLIGAIIPLRR